MFESGEEEHTEACLFRNIILDADYNGVKATPTLKKKEKTKPKPKPKQKNKGPDSITLG